MSERLMGWVEDEYSKYPEEVIIKILHNALEYSQKGLYKEYEQYLIAWHNNAFALKREIEDHVQAIDISGKLSEEASEVLSQLLECPTSDGDVTSKIGKGELYRYGLVTRIVDNGDFGKNAANELGWLVGKYINLDT